MWEDPQNKDGGKFVLTMPKKDTREGRGDEWWLYTVLAVIGETMDVTGDEVCGCVVSIRKSQDRIALWLRSSDRKRCTEVGARWKKALEVSNKTGLKYQAHRDGEWWITLVVCFFLLLSDDVIVFLLSHPCCACFNNQHQKLLRLVVLFKTKSSSKSNIHTKF